DQIRREFVRGGEVAVVSTGGKRAAAVVLMHAGRTLGWSVQETLARASEVAGRAPLEKFVREYLERHRDKTPHDAPRS
ncbi:MAG TPA: hypothetical protein VNO81_00205, partial [Candidatus Nitrosotenuis sp.]|nr:hypothetical protein [Candidatus Nitrosotenuis sp.]